MNPDARGDAYERIRKNPKFAELVRKRGRFCGLLSAAVFGVYFAFILVIAFAPDSFGTPLGPNAVTTIGIPVGVFIIVFAFALTGIYVRRANGEFDRLTKEILEDTE